MLIQYLIPLTLAFAIAALALLFGALLLRRRIGTSPDAVRRATVYLDERAAMLPIILSTGRADLAERDAGVEQQLWTIARFDDQVAAATAALAERRRGLDALRGELASRKAGIERIKSALRMMMRAIELRRTILG